MSEIHERPPVDDQIFERATQIIREQKGINAESALFRSMDELGIQIPAERAKYMGLFLKKMKETRKEENRRMRQDSAWSERLAEKAAKNPTHAAKTHEE